FMRSRRAFDSSPRMILPSSASTTTPSASLLAIFSGTFRTSLPVIFPAAAGPRISPYGRSSAAISPAARAATYPAWFPSVVIRTGHIIAATPANQLALVRLERRGARWTILRWFFRCRRLVLFFPAFAVLGKPPVFHKAPWL